MMATLLSNFVWEGTAPEMTDTLPGIAGGHIYKQLDTGESYIRVSGAWEYINLGLAFIKATKSGRVTTDGSGIAEITFNTPFINNEYSIALSCEDPGGPPVRGAIAYKYDRAPTGFKIITRNTSGIPVGGIVVSWLATRDYNP
jgi:hypothetical protein